ncbi:Pkinase-domain-containing protein [Tilletiaria anomala UBC 951]|uniref:non-specific serine/threonine protein kinase n=1 Tax=Tilletiaria anomala (strain ATCC 24038 / CBS 436.72 / UBC 951) TaxID=1037660 RepID=A0A066WR87_TILAU|nr:Pkinase-domain-containing protein [Tilletiaria anomala UBC 951]KDN53519.1 Pkinase-domain-containing protein [Tilletiaria anomala UBC 951]
MTSGEPNGGFDSGILPPSHVRDPGLSKADNGSQSTLSPNTFVGTDQIIPTPSQSIDSAAASFSSKSAATLPPSVLNQPAPMSIPGSALPSPAHQGQPGLPVASCATSPPSSRLVAAASGLRSPPSARQLSLNGPMCEREIRAREMMSDSDTESNLSSRPPTPDRHRFPKHRLSGMQSKDSFVVKHGGGADGDDSNSLKLVREVSPYDLSHAGEVSAPLSIAQLDSVPPTPLTAVPLGKSLRGAQQALQQKTQSQKQSSGTQQTRDHTSKNGSSDSSRPSSPPPRAMSPPKSAATTRVSRSGYIPGNGVDHATPSPLASANGRPSGAGSGAFSAPEGPATPATEAAIEQTTIVTPVATRPAQTSTSIKLDGRALFKRMLSGSQSNSVSAAANAGAVSPSSRGSTPPGSPGESVGTTDASGSLLMNAIQNMGMISPPTSQPPSRNVSLRRKENASPNRGASGNTAEQQQHGRLTAAALRDLDAKGYTASGPGASAVAPGPPVVTGSKTKKASGTSSKDKDRDADAKSTASSTLREMIMGSAPKLSRRGSSASGGSKKGASQGGGDTASLLKKYGVCEKAAIGKGATAVVRLAHKWDRSTEKLYAVKEFRKRRKNETEKEYVKKLTSEFCISSTLHHINIVETVDLVQDENRHWCEVMEFCPGGDLYAAIKRGGMSQAEIECCFKQTMNGIAYLHSMGVAHRDIKPENLLLDAQGHVKITDFGVSDVFRMCWEKSTHYSKGLCGSEPYIAPEQFEQKEYDARLVDVWAAAVVFYCMQFQELPWRVAKMSDPTFKEFVHSYHSSNAPSPLSNLSPRDCRPLLKKMLCPDPKQRWGTEEILKDPWFASVSVCGIDLATDHKHSIHLTLSAG